MDLIAIVWMCLCWKSDGWSWCGVWLNWTLEVCRTAWSVWTWESIQSQLVELGWSVCGI